jgi:hypothetical protein
VHNPSKYKKNFLMIKVQAIASEAPIKNSVNELAEQMTKLTEGGVNEEKKKTIRERLRAVAVALVKMSPKIAQRIIGLTPLSAFTRLVGEAFTRCSASSIAQYYTTYRSLRKRQRACGNSRVSKIVESIIRKYY